MDPSSLHQHQEMMSRQRQRQSVEKMIGLSKAQDQRKPKPQAEEALKCPRCDSTNTKFCYYNNYSLSQPRYFCKSCRRYWTKGGTLRNVPVGGGCRKTKRSSSASKRGIQDHQFTTATTTNTTFSSSSYDHSINDNLSLALARLQNHPCNTTTTTGSGPGPLGLGLGFDHDLSIHYDNLLAANINPPGFLDAFRSDGLQSMQYCGGYNGNGEMGEVVDNGGEMMIPYDHGRSSEQSENNNNRTFWGLPWQLNNGDHIDMGGLESAGGRTSWNNNGFSSTYWHGLLNSPLM